MSWIESVEYEQANERLRRVYDRSRDANGQLDNIVIAHGLRPHTLDGHLALYRNVLHHQSNSLDKWLLEVIGVYVSLLNDCAYCVTHHSRGLSRLIGEEKTAEIRRALESGVFDPVFSAQETAALHYVRELTEAPATINDTAVNKMRSAGLNDGEILEINQVAAYFAYANRTVLGLGVELESSTN